MSDNDSIDIIVHGPYCPEWPKPQTYDEWMAARLVKDVPNSDDWDGDPPAAGVWRCPFCGEAVYIFLDGGKIEFGLEPREVSVEEGERINAFIETFTPLAKPPE